jgi:hypothetical protein
VTELVRGQISDRPWGVTFGQLGLRELTGQLTLHAVDGRDYRVAFAHGAVVGATSPQPADAAIRIALTTGLINSSQVPTVARQIAATPEIDEIALIASACRLVPEQIAKLRRRVIAQRAARTFSIESGAFVVDDEITIMTAPDAAVDIRTVIYQGARSNLSELRLITELRGLGSHFTLGATAIEHASWFGIEGHELPILDALRDGTTLPEIEAKYRDLDPRSVQSVIYALVSCHECVATKPEPAVPRPRTPTPSLPNQPIHDGISVSFKPRGADAIPQAVTSQGSSGNATNAMMPLTQAEDEFRAETSTRTGPFTPRPPYSESAPPTTRARSGTMQPPIGGIAPNPPVTSQRSTSGTVPPPIGEPVPPAMAQRLKAGTAPPPIGHTLPNRPRSNTAPLRGKAPFPATDPASSSSGIAIPSEIAHSNGTDRITQSLSEAAESFRRGVEALRVNQLPLAIEQLTRASTLNPHEFEYSAMLAFAQLANALPGDRPKSADKVRKMLNHLSQKSRDPVQALVFLGQLERLLDNDKQAAVHFRAALASQPDHAQATIELQRIEDKALEKSGISGLFRKR